MNLYDEYEKTDVRYYDEEIGDFEADFERTRDRIKKYYETGSKEELNDGFDDLNKKRLNHSMSLAYLGILINKELPMLNMEIRVNNVLFDFIYVWKIICFYHDLGYNFESNNNYIFISNSKNQKNEVNGYSCSKAYAIRNSQICFDAKFTFQYNRYFSNSFHQMFITYKNTSKKNQLSNYDYERINNDFSIMVRYDNGKKATMKKSNFYKNTIEKYYGYRTNEMGVFDHGILGGYMLFDRLVKKYINKMANVTNKTDFSANKRQYLIEQIPLFAYMADCIVSHNIFFPNFGDEDLYKEYGLDELVKYTKPVKFNFNPVLFLLYLVDSIDPIKYFEQNGKLDYIDILKSIDIVFLNSNTFKLSREFFSRIDITTFNNYIKRIEGLKTWLGIDVFADYGKNSVKITIL